MAVGGALELKGPSGAAGPAAWAPAVREAWSRIQAEPGARPLLLGGFAFEPRGDSGRGADWREFGNGRLTLPELLFEEDAEERRLTAAAQVAPDRDLKELERRLCARIRNWFADAPAGPGLGGALRSSPPPGELAERYALKAREMIGAIRAGGARKVVLADCETVGLDGGESVGSLLAALRAAHPRCLSFACGFGEATLVGSTPERVVRLEGERVRAEALAGTAARDDDPDRDALEAIRLRSSEKDLAEHAFVVEAVAATLSEACSEVEIPSQPGLRRTGNAQHLNTEISGRVRSGLHLLELLERLHPSPAVAGTPRPEALELIRKHESFDRGWYAGTVGWLEPSGGGEFHAALRCALLRGRAAQLFAGAGLVADSKPELEAAETRLKLQVMRDALERACAG
ncbi:MAG: isochorismate synthase [Proteobacteria bacterium]|nr:isochorismate synthase [Pseudomonadota bacterium]